MLKSKLDKLIKKQINDDLKSRGIKKIHLTEAEYNKELYKVALDILIDKRK